MSGGTFLGQSRRPGLTDICPVSGGECQGVGDQLASMTMKHKIKLLKMKERLCRNCLKTVHRAAKCFSMPKFYKCDTHTFTLTHTHTHTLSLSHTHTHVRTHVRTRKEAIPCLLHAQPKIRAATHACAVHNTTLHCTALHCTTLRYTTLHYTTLHYTTLHNTTLHYTTPHNTTPHYTALHCTALHCTALHCTALHYTTLPANYGLFLISAGAIERCGNFGTLQLPSYHDFKSLKTFGEASKICRNLGQEIPVLSDNLNVCMVRLQKKMQERIGSTSELRVWFNVDSSWTTKRHVVCFVCKFDHATILYKCVHKRHLTLFSMMGKCVLLFI